MPKNLSGGKSHKKHGSKEQRGVKHNREMATAFIEDILEGEDMPTELVLARVTKCYGFGRFDLMDQNGKNINATLRGVISCKGKAARAAGNPMAITPDKFVLLQEADYGAQIIAIFSGAQIASIRDKITAVKSFFNDMKEDEGGFEFEGNEEDIDVAAI